MSGDRSRHRTAGSPAVGDDGTVSAGVSASPQMILVRVLGPLELVVGGSSVDLRPAQRRIIAILTVEAGRPVGIDRLIDRVWRGAPPATARTAIYVHVSQIRKSAPSVISTTGSGYAIDPGVVDISRFERHAAATAAAAHVQDWRGVERSASAALAWWRGQPWQDLAEDEFAAPDVARLLEQRLILEESLGDAMIALGQVSRVVPSLRALVDAHPLHERLRQQLMEALYLSGRQGDALREYQQARVLLQQVLGVEPSPALRSIEQRILNHDPSLGSRSRSTARHNLPDPTTSFIGRDGDLADLREQVRRARVVTVVGGPGVGKTRLAIEFARTAIGEHPGGVWFVDLAGVRSESAMVATIGTVVGADDHGGDADRLTEAITASASLIVLDNAENILGPVRRLCGLVAISSGSTRIIVTTRRRVHWHGEVVIRVRPLSAGMEGALGLLVDRIRLVDGTFVLTSENRAWLEHLSDGLGAIPLSIELVARQMGSLGVADVSRLFELAVGVSAIDRAFTWSTGLLPEIDRDVLGVCTVLAGPFTLERLTQLWQAMSQYFEPRPAIEFAVAGSVSRLVDAALLSVAQGSGSATRYRVPEPVRDLASEQLDDNRRVELRRVHAEAFLASAVAASSTSSTERSAAYATIGREIADHRAALTEFADRNRWQDVATMASSLVPYWYGHLLAWEGRTWLGDAITHDRGTGDRVSVVAAAAFLDWAVHDYDAADTKFERCREIGRRTGDRKVVADAWFGLGTIHQKRRFRDGAAMLREAVDLYRTLDGCEAELGQCLMFLGLDQAYQGDGTLAVTLLTEAIALLEVAGDIRDLSKVHRWLAHCWWRQGDIAVARHHVGLALDLAEEAGDVLAGCGATLELAHIEMCEGDVTAAACHLVDALAPVPPQDEVDICQVLVPIARLALLVDEPTVVACILDHVDEVYERTGWRRLDETPWVAPLRTAARNGAACAGGAVEAARSVIERVLASGRPD